MEVQFGVAVASADVREMLIWAFWDSLVYHFEHTKSKAHAYIEAFLIVLVIIDSQEDGKHSSGDFDSRIEAMD